ncbi:MAG TPA: hypothetical protein VFL98_02485 [Candidatus Paceibacterota bacterium]|nr:hypothetical protein [Candidatus Paceibacterota bacterium]
MTYASDGSRVKLVEPGDAFATHFPNRSYEKYGATSTDLVYGAGLLLATIARPAGTTTPSVTYIHPDHLGSTNATTDGSV